MKKFIAIQFFLFLMVLPPATGCGSASYEKYDSHEYNRSASIDSRDYIVGRDQSSGIHWSNAPSDVSPGQAIGGLFFNDGTAGTSRDIRGRFENTYDTTLGDMVGKDRPVKSEDSGEMTKKPVDPVKNPENPNKTPQTDEDYEQKLIYSANFMIGVYDAELIKTKIKKVIKEKGGYLQEEQNMRLKLRVPAGQFSAIIEEISKFGRVISKNVYTQDVTEEFYDLSTRIRVKRKSLANLEEILKKAVSVKDQLEIRREISKLLEELERIEGRLRFLKTRVAFSIIEINFRLEKEIYNTPSKLNLPIPWLYEHSLERLLDLSR